MLGEDHTSTLEVMDYLANCLELGGECNCIGCTVLRKFVERFCFGTSYSAVINGSMLSVGSTARMPLSKAT